jgi:hypothetical protein
LPNQLLNSGHAFTFAVAEVLMESGASDKPRR